MLTQYEIWLGAVLHDIGKFAQRAHGGTEPDDFPDSMRGLVLPHNQAGLYTHTHALWTYYAIEKYLAPVLMACRDIDWDVVRDLASFHHNPRNPAEEVIRDADCISAKIDRIQDDETHYKRGDHLKVALRPIIASVRLRDGKSALESDTLTAGWRTLPAALTADNMLPTQYDDSRPLTNAYRQAWDGFLQEIKAIPNEILAHRDRLTACLGGIILKYTWSIPSATNDKLHDIPLYDHLTSTAAIALARFAAGEISTGTKPYRMFAATPTGIQNFIFRNPTGGFKGNTKVIRARSLTIAAMTDILRYALSDASGILPYTQIVQAGGRLVAILPNTPDMIGRIQTFALKLEDDSFTRWHGAFGYACSFDVEADDNDLAPGNFGVLMDRVNYSLLRARERRLESKLSAGTCIVDVEYDQTLCAACGALPGTRSNHDESDLFCEGCFSMLTAGGELPRSGYLCIVPNNPQLSLFSSGWGATLQRDHSTRQDAVAVFSLDTKPGFAGWNVNNYVPLDGNQRVLEFSQIADKAVHEIPNSTSKPSLQGTRYLAHIRLDVDHLGHIFSLGMGDNVSVSRYAALSRTIHQYFNIRVRKMLETDYPDFYTVLSGGDDLYVIGPWDQALSFVTALRKDFGSYVCANPDVHFSSGIELARPKTPVALVAHAAEERISQAKRAGRDRLCYYRTHTWDEAACLAKETDWYTTHIRDCRSKIKHAFVNRLLRLLRVRIRYDDDKDVRALASVSHLRYDLARNILRKEQGSIVNSDEIEHIIKGFDGIAPANTRILEGAIRQALYQTRTNTGSSDERRT